MVLARHGLGSDIPPKLGPARRHAAAAPPFPRVRRRSSRVCAAALHRQQTRSATLTVVESPPGRAAPRSPPAINTG
jgi:hypothetical protein